MRIVTAICQNCHKEFSYRYRAGRKFCSHICSLTQPKADPELERFWSRVSVGGKDECWPFLPAVEDERYGSFPADDGKNWIASRFAWTIKHGPIPEGMCVLHTCDYPPCVNDNHLFLGTKKDNAQDMIFKGRGGWKKGAEWEKAHAGKSAKGELNRHAKLTAADIPVIRKQCADGKTKVALAEEFGVSPSAIRFIVNRKNWKHVP